MTELLVAPAGGNGRSVATELLAQMEVERPTSLSVEPHTAGTSGETPARWHLFLTSACLPSKLTQGKDWLCSMGADVQQWLRSNI